MTDKHSPAERQEKIKELIQHEAIGDQQKIVDLLHDRHGIDTNQAVVSRDLRKLGVVKKPHKSGIMVYELPSVDVQTEILKLALVDISHNGVMIVIKTHPALADFVGDCLDSHPDLEIMGCLSGENVVFVTPNSISDIDRICKNICRKFQFKKVKDT